MMIPLGDVAETPTSTPNMPSRAIPRRTTEPSQSAPMTPTTPTTHDDQMVALEQALAVLATRNEQAGDTLAGLTLRMAALRLGVMQIELDLLRHERDTLVRGCHQ